MKLSPIILALRLAETSFGTRIGGLIELSAVEGNTLVNEVAFVIPFDEESKKDENDTSANQIVRERFSVVTALKNDNNLDDKTGIEAYDRIDTIRSELFKTLINFDIGYDHSIEYDRGRLLEFNPAWVWFRFDFAVFYRIVSDESGYGYIEVRPFGERTQPSQLPDFNEIYADYILAPSGKLPYVGKLPASDYIDVDASQRTNKSDNPNLGGYDGGYAKAFKKLLS